MSRVMNTQSRAQDELITNVEVDPNDNKSFLMSLSTVPSFAQVHTALSNNCSLSLSAGVSSQVLANTVHILLVNHCHNTARRLVI